MNVIFLDFDGVIDTKYYKSYEQQEEKIKILADICHEYDAKVVIEASAKTGIDPDTLEVDEDAEWLQFLFRMFKKYNIDVIGRTPDCKKRDEHFYNCYLGMWKEDEIRLYLFRHPEIDHYCVIDDDDIRYYKKYRYSSDLNKVRNHLVITEDYLEDDPTKEGLLPEHKEQVGEILKKENEIKKFALKRKITR